MDSPAIRRDLHEENRLSWNEATKAHNSHKVDQAAFLRAGGSELFPEEVELLGDLRGKRLVHLQSNSGQDTLSLVQRGAIATGVDISDEAVAFARQLSADSGIPAEFVRADIYDWLRETAVGGERFDRAFCSYGAICWLSDVGAWARGIAAILRPGGRFVTVEFHPLLSMFETDWTLANDYFARGQPQTWEDGVSDYVAASGPTLAPSGYARGVVGFRNPHRVHEFQWGTAEVAGALLGAGFVLESFREYPYANGWMGRERMRVAPGRRVYPPGDIPSLPLMYSLAARLPG